MMKLIAPFAALTLAASAEAQIRPVSRNSELSSYYTQYDPDGSHTDRWSDHLTDWVSGVHSIPSCSEDLELSQSQIRVAASVDGTGYYSQMSRTGFARGSGYLGEFVFNLDTVGSFTLTGALRANQGNASVSFYDDTRGVLLFSAASRSFAQNPFSRSGSMQPGRYRLVLEAHGLAIQPYGPGDANPNALLTIVPAPGPFAVLALAALRRRRR